MACEQNVLKGKVLVLLVENDAGDGWEILGGVRTRGLTVDNPVEDITSSSTTSDYSESDWTGFSQSTINVSGVADIRTGIVDPVTGLTIIGYDRLEELANTGNRCGNFWFYNTETQKGVRGYYNITSYNESGDTPGLVNFDSTLQSKADIERTDSSDTPVGP